MRLAATTASTVALLLLALLAGSAGAATLTFGSPLSVPAVKDTANDLNYQGSNVPLPGSVFHIPHDGADGALWNVQLPVGDPSAPVGGQVVSVRLEGCAKSNGPAPLTQIHFQTLAPVAGGGARVELTSQAFEIPVCGVGGASGSTISSYDPINLCVAQGDYVSFNEEGGFVRCPERSAALPCRRPLHGDRQRARRDDGLVHSQQRRRQRSDVLTDTTPPTTTALPRTQTRN